MEKMKYVMILEKSKTYKKITKEIVENHVENIRKLDEAGKLEICGVLSGCPGFAGLIILKTENYEEATKICEAEPFVVGGYATYKLIKFQEANKENNYLL